MNPKLFELIVKTAKENKIPFKLMLSQEVLELMLMLFNYVVQVCLLV